HRGQRQRSDLQAAVDVNHHTSDGRVECAAKYDSTAVYTAAAVGAAGASTGVALKLSGDSRMALLDIPTLADDLNTAGFPHGNDGGIWRAGQAACCFAAMTTGRPGWMCGGYLPGATKGVASMRWAWSGPI
ncbi:hypothetical protein, partial [Propionivibrio sp.]|uniref:hypothetical protein n=1 Tax=Propionivibrio sp. TaxID=2212460 RepID=UPI0025F49DB4